MKYTTLLIDNDDTLMDFAAAERNGICLTFKENGIPYTKELLSSYSEINASLWKRLERGEIKREEIFEKRFQIFASKHGLSIDTKKVSSDYMRNLELGHELFPEVLPLLSELCTRYSMYIVTNGHSRTQNRRIDDADIRRFFDGVFVSEEIGYQKPMKEYFQFVFSNIKEKNKSKILIIGDSLSSDILGGINAGIDTCWFNRKGADCGQIKPTYEINTLNDIKKVLG